MKPSKYFLPLSWLFGAVVRFKNFLFDKGIISSKEFDVPVICIGNLSAGGTGKTPMVISVVEILLQEGIKPAILSRGYKRNSGAIHVINKDSSVAGTGDEPMIFFRHFPNVPVVLTGNRAKGIEYIRHQFPEINAVVMDDGFQHRWVKPSMNILLTSFNHPMVADRLLPAGYLREPATTARRAQFIIVTKTPEPVNREMKQHLLSRIKKLSSAPVVFSTLTHGKPKHVFTDEIFKDDLNKYHCLLVSGISNAGSLKDHIGRHSLKCEWISFPNHHPYMQKDAKRIAAGFDNIAAVKKIILTTEKDAVKLNQFSELAGLPVYYLPVNHEFMPEDSALLKSELINHARKN